MVPRVGVEPTRPCGHYVLNVARLPFRHPGSIVRISNLSTYPMVNDAPVPNSVIRPPSFDPKRVQRVAIDDALNLVFWDAG